MPRRVIPQLVALLLLLPAGVAGACEYCVREVGFVALHNEPYRVVITVPPDTPDSERDRLLAQARAEIGPSNVVVSIATGYHAGPGTENRDPQTLSSPRAIVYAPGEPGLTRSALLRPASESPSSDLVIEHTYAELTHSPAREGLAEALIDGYATVLLVQGADEDANRAAHELVEHAIQRINAVKSGFDRVIEVGPALRIISAEERQREYILLWALGIETDETAMPSVAVLYGKGRRLGDVLTGNTLTDTALFTMLSVVARDCECDLDRGWLYGTSIPLVWDDAMRRRAYDALGFDPESAATRAAVSRILERGPGSGTSVRDPFTEDTGTNIGIPGLTIHELGDPASSVPPAPESVKGDGSGDEPASRFPSLDDLPAPEPSFATADVQVNESSPMRLVWIALGLLAFVVLVGGGILANLSRGDD